MITSHKRGHKISFENNQWIYMDTKESTKKERPCVRCGKMPTKERYDACIGELEGVKSACCGHGVEEGYIIKE